MRYRARLTATVNEMGKQFSPEIKCAAKSALIELGENPLLDKELHGDLISFRSYRFMRHRIIYRINSEDKTVLVWAIGHRPDIYEQLSLLLVKYLPEDGC